MHSSTSPFIAFSNSGEIDLQLIATFGCSVKETENPIGFFGTGLKYALAVLLRTGHTIHINIGEQQQEVSSREMTLRGKVFQGVYVGDTYLGFTTELGKNWEVWMAYRELYCNAQDEIDAKIWETTENVPPQAGKTTMIVRGPDIVQQHREREKFLLLEPPTHRLGNTVEVITKPSTGLFYKGVRVMTFELPALFTYNIISELKLTEDRTCASGSSAQRVIEFALLEHAPKELLRTVLLAPETTTEHKFDFDWQAPKPIEHFYALMQALESDCAMSVNKSALRVYHRNLGKNGISPKEVEMTVVEKKTLEKALTFCAAIGYAVRDAYPIKITESLGIGVLALAERSTNTIFLTRQVFVDGGTKGVASTLVEEFLHLKHGFNDCTRQMQTHLFNKIISLGEECQGEPL